MKSINTDLKERAFIGVFWSAIERFGTMGLVFVSNIFLARILGPEEYGLMGILVVFMLVSNAIIEGGFGSALIQKKNPTEVDFSTIFYLNILLSCLLFCFLYFFAPGISVFFNQPKLSVLLRAQSLVIIINAFALIQYSILRKTLNFKKLAQCEVVSTIISSVSGVILAFQGHGVWSLVYMRLINVSIRTILLWRVSSWRPGFFFSSNSLQQLWSFGAYMLTGRIVDEIYRNVQTVIIGKAFSTTDLGYYSQAQKLEHFSVKSLSQIVNQVTFPLFSEFQGRHDKLQVAFQKSIKMITFLNFPLMMILIVIAPFLFELLYTSKWMQSVPYFQILCFGGLFWTLNASNTNILMSLGKSKLHFYSLLAKRLLGVFIVILGLYFGVFGLMWAITINAFLFYLINAFFTQKLIHYSILGQFKDVAPGFFISLFSAGLVYFVSGYLTLGLVGTLITLSLLFVTFFVLLAIFFKVDAVYLYYDLFKVVICRLQKDT